MITMMNISQISENNIVAEDMIVGASSLFDYLPYILVGICVIMFLIIVGSIICLIINGKKAKMKINTEEMQKENMTGSK